MNEQQIVSRFREDTRQQTVTLPSSACTSFGQVLQTTLPQTGFLANIYLYWTGTVTIPAAPSGNWATYPPLPYCAIRRLRVFTSENIEIVNTSGWGMAFHNLFKQKFASHPVDVISYLNTNGRSTLLTTQSGALSAGAFTISGWLKIPIMTDDATMLGLILLQSLEVRCILEITSGNAADFVASGATSPTAISLTFTPLAEFYSVPDSAANYPNLDWVHLIQEETLGFTANGDVIYRPQIGNVYMGIRGVVENSGAQVAPSGLTSVSFKYAQSVVPYSENYSLHLARTKWTTGVCPPDGSVIFTFDNGNGNPSIFEPRDLVNTSQQTDVQIVTTTTGLTISSAQIRWIKEQLAPIG